MYLMLPSTTIETPDGRPVDGDAVLRFIERIARTCYKSEDGICEGSHLRMAKALIGKQHGAMLEFFDVVVRFVVNRGVSHELVRMRIASYAQESTRWCNYAKKGVAFIIPPKLQPVLQEGEYSYEEPDPPQIIGPARVWFHNLLNTEQDYLQLIERGWAAQEARDVLPNALKTDIVAKYNIREWRHVFRLRTAKDAHPQMQEVMRPLLDQFKRTIPVLFDDIDYA